MTTEAAIEFPTTVFHEDGVRNQRVEDLTTYERLIGHGWHEKPQPPPPPAAPPLTPEEQQASMQSELEGLGDQFDAQAQVVTFLEGRVTELDEKIGAVVNSTIQGAESVNSRIESLEARVKTLEQSRQGASGVTVAFQDRLNAADADLAEVKASMEQAALTLQTLLERLSALENKKKGN